MVDRRKLIVGGGAAALATTLAAVAGGNPAAAMSPAALQRITVRHARQALDLVDPDRGLVRPAGFQELFQRGYVTYRESEPRDPRADDLEAWVRQRMMNLCRTDSFYDAGTKISQTRTLLGFSILAYSQHQDTRLPDITSSMPVDDVLRRLEPDFLPVLVQQIDEASARSRAFADAVTAGTSEMDRIIAEHLREWSGDGISARATAQMSDRDMVSLSIGIIGFISFMYWVKGGLK